MDFITREPTAQDAASLASLHVRTWREAYAHLLPRDFFTEKYVQGRHAMWEHVLTHPRDDVTVLVAESDERLVGFAWAGPGIGTGDEAPPRQRQLYAIYLAESHHGCGAAQVLLDDTIGAEPAMLWVAKQNPRATAFYTRNGFVFDGTEQVDPHAPSITDARMVR